MSELNKHDQEKLIKDILVQYEHYTDQQKQQLKETLKNCITEQQINCVLAQYEETNKALGKNLNN
jgi:hypothetical protein